MRVTAIAQGFNKWVARLHRQVPLTGRESQQLLNAMTGSFRAQLDEAHPTKARDEAKPAFRKTFNKVLASLETSSPSPKIASDPVHVTSAVESADRHLASMLTSPLLMGALPTAAKPRSQRARRSNIVPEWQIEQNEGAKALQTDKADIRSIPLTPETSPVHAQIASETPTDIARILQEPSLLADLPKDAEEQHQRLIVEASDLKKDQRTQSPAAADEAPIELGLDEQNSSRNIRRVASPSKPVRRDHHDSNRNSLWYHLVRPAT